MPVNSLIQYRYQQFPRTGDGEASGGRASGSGGDFRVFWKLAWKRQELMILDDV